MKNWAAQRGFEFYNKSKQNAEKIMRFFEFTMNSGDKLFDGSSLKSVVRTYRDGQRMSYPPVYDREYESGRTATKRHREHKSLGAAKILHSALVLQGWRMYRE